MDKEKIKFAVDKVLTTRVIHSINEDKRNVHLVIDDTFFNEIEKVLEE